MNQTKSRLNKISSTKKKQTKLIPIILNFFKNIGFAFSTYKLIVITINNAIFQTKTTLVTVFMFSLDLRSCQYPG
jgi:hypothetical protein